MQCRPEVLQAFATALRQAEDDPTVRCIVITGAGEHFVGGGDVKGFGETIAMEPLERKHLYEQRLVANGTKCSVLERIGKPTVARVARRRGRRRHFTDARLRLRRCRHRAVSSSSRTVRCRCHRTAH